MCFKVSKKQEMKKLFLKSVLHTFIVLYIFTLQHKIFIWVSDISNQFDSFPFRYSYTSPKWHPTPVLLSGKSHGQRSMVDYNPWGHKRVRLYWNDLAHTQEDTTTSSVPAAGIALGASLLSGLGSAGRQGDPQFPEGRGGRDSCAEACAEAELIQGLGIQVPNVTRAQGRFSRGNQKLEMPRGFARGNPKTGSRYMVVPEYARMLRSLI